MPDRNASAIDATRSADLRKGSTAARRVETISTSDAQVRRRSRRDWLASEEPLEIRIEGAGGSSLPVSVTMRTPGADFDLAAGFLFGEGIVHSAESILSIRYCVDAPQQYNTVTVRTSPGADFDPALLQRNFYTTSSCGVCGKASIEAVMGPACERVAGTLAVPADLLPRLPARLRKAQRLFERTGGLHAAALFDATGELRLLREDVGRHNAMDKLVGASLLAGELPLHDRILLVSGRLSFELVQKAVRAGACVLAGVSAPSSLAVELAEQAGLTLVGFLREGTFNVYAGGERILD